MTSERELRCTFAQCFMVVPMLIPRITTVYISGPWPGIPRTAGRTYGKRTGSLYSRSSRTQSDDACERTRTLRSALWCVVRDGLVQSITSTRRVDIVGTA